MLPSRLFLGDLDPKAFNRTADGWTVRYVDADKATFVELRTSRSQFVGSPVWRGVQGNTSYVLLDRGEPTGGAWRKLAELMAFAGWPVSWDKAAEAWLTLDYNVGYIPAQKKFGCCFMIPDGFFLVIVIPVPVFALRKLMDVMARISNDPAVAAPVSGYASLAMSTVNYVEGKCPTVPDEPHALWLYTLDRTGLPPVAAPTWESVPDGSRALTVRRTHYNAVITCALRDLERVIRHLLGAGVLGGREGSQPGEQFPHGVEFRALVMQSALNEIGADFFVFDQNRTRRVWHRLVSDVETLEALEALADAPDADTVRIREAEEISASLRSQFLGKSGRRH